MDFPDLVFRRRLARYMLVDRSCREAHCNLFCPMRKSVINCVEMEIGNRLPRSDISSPPSLVYARRSKLSRSCREAHRSLFCPMRKSVINCLEMEIGNGLPRSGISSPPSPVYARRSKLSQSSS